MLLAGRKCLLKTKGFRNVVIICPIFIGPGSTGLWSAVTGLHELTCHVSYCLTCYTTSVLHVAKPGHLEQNHKEIKTKANCLSLSVSLSYTGCINASLKDTVHDSVESCSCLRQYLCLTHLKEHFIQKWKLTYPFTPYANRISTVRVCTLNTSKLQRTRHFY